MRFDSGRLALPGQASSSWAVDDAVEFRAWPPSPARVPPPLARTDSEFARQLAAEEDEVIDVTGGGNGVDGGGDGGGPWTRGVVVAVSGEAVTVQPVVGGVRIVVALGSDDGASQLRADDQARGVLRERQAAEASELAFRARMADAGLVIVEEDADGNCMFRGLARQVRRRSSPDPGARGGGRSGAADNRSGRGGAGGVRHPESTRAFSSGEREEDPIG